MRPEDLTESGLGAIKYRIYLGSFRLERNLQNPLRQRNVGINTTLEISSAIEIEAFFIWHLPPTIPGCNKVDLE